MRQRTLTVAPAAPRLTVREAAAALATAGTRQFLFFLNPEHGRGRVLYRRYDGNFGLLEAAPR